MAEMVISDKLDLVEVANAIREKAGTSDALAFPVGFAEAIAAIESGTQLPEGVSHMMTGTLIPASDQKTIVLDTSSMDRDKNSIRMFLIYLSEGDQSSFTKNSIMMGATAWKSGTSVANTTSSRPLTLGQVVRYGYGANSNDSSSYPKIATWNNNSITLIFYYPAPAGVKYNYIVIFEEI